jgi:hypothetical protein
MQIQTGSIAILGSLALVLPFSAGAQTAGSPPVVINACGPMINSNNTQTLFGVPVAQSSWGIKIQFTNQSAKTANLVNFSVDSNGDSFIIRDVGTFSPGVEITHRFSNGAGQAFVLPQFISPKINCHVQSVSFADGTTWRRGQSALSPPAQANASALSLTPKAVDMDRNAESHLFMVLSNAKIAAFTERDTCQGIAAISLAASGEAAATYTVKPLAAGTCSAMIRDEAGNSVMLPVTVR